MSLRSINPYDGTLLATIEGWDAVKLNHALQDTADARQAWADTAIEKRCGLMQEVARVIHARRDELARLVSLEMGKLIGEATAEVEKCALVCEYYAENGIAFLADESLASDAGHSYVAYQPIGTVLAVMPWNFPLWQVFRFAAPALVAGNTALLKHASNVPQCALAIEEIFHQAGVPDNVFSSLMISASMVDLVIADERVHAVTLTGSEPAGSAVAAQAGKYLKKSVLELGGSDAFIILEDADLDAAVQAAVISRYLNCGQSCIAAKRFIPVAAIADEFAERFKQAVEALVPGNPLDVSVSLAPMARYDLRDELHKQVLASIHNGATALTGCMPEGGEGSFYQASILDYVKPDMRAYDEELFGPVAIIIRASDEQDALRIANGSRFGLGGSVWTEDLDRGEKVARAMQCGCVFVNGLVKSDPRLPFGGIKASGYGRELSHHGIREFVNAKTVWIR